MAVRGITWTVRFLPAAKKGTDLSRVPAEQATAAIVNWLHFYPEEVLQQARGIMNDEAAQIQAEAVGAVPADLGALRQSIQVVADGDNKRDIVAGAPAAPYAGYIEYGTTTGRPSYRKILEWAKRKGIPEEAAFSIRSKIVREGIKAQPFLFPAFERHRHSFINRLKGVFTA